MITNTPVYEDLLRGVDRLYSPDELKKKLDSGKQLRIKLGMDPTARFFTMIRRCIGIRHWCDGQREDSCIITLDEKDCVSDIRYHRSFMGNEYD